MSEIITVEHERTVDSIALEIITIRDQAKRLLLMSSIEIGRRLCEAKEMVRHGEWADWLQRKVSYSQSTANNLMRIFREFGDEQIGIGGASKLETFANLEYSQAVALFALPDAEREEFVAEHDVGEMSVRQLKDEIAAFTAKLEAEQAKNAQIEARLAELEAAEREEQAVLEEQITALQEKNKLTGQQQLLEKAKADLKALKAKAKERDAEAEKKLRADIERELTAEAEKKLEAVREAEAKKAAGAVEEARAEAERLAEELAAMEKRFAIEADPDATRFKFYFEEIKRSFGELAAVIERMGQAGKAEQATRFENAVHKLGTMIAAQYSQNRNV